MSFIAPLEHLYRDYNISHASDRSTSNKIKECKRFILLQTVKIVAQVALYLILSVGAFIAVTLFAPAIYAPIVACVAMLCLPSYYKMIQPLYDSIKTKQIELRQCEPQQM